MTETPKYRDGDAAETTETNPKSWIAWKRRAEQAEQALALRGEPVAKEKIREIARKTAEEAFHNRGSLPTIYDFEKAILAGIALYAAPISGERAACKTCEGRGMVATIGWVEVHPYQEAADCPDCNGLGFKDRRAAVSGERVREAQQRGAYWLIERGSPAEWWVGTSRISAADGGEWTRNSSKAQHFNEWGARNHAKELTQWGISGPLIATEHIDCIEPAVSGERDE